MFQFAYHLVVKNSYQVVALRAPMLCEAITIFIVYLNSWTRSSIIKSFAGTKLVEVPHYLEDWTGIQKESNKLEMLEMIKKMRQKNNKAYKCKMEDNKLEHNMAGNDLEV